MEFVAVDWTKVFVCMFYMYVRCSYIFKLHDNDGNFRLARNNLNLFTSENIFICLIQFQLLTFVLCFWLLLFDLFLTSFFWHRLSHLKEGKNTENLNWIYVCRIFAWEVYLYLHLSMCLHISDSLLSSQWQNKCLNMIFNWPSSTYNFIYFPFDIIHFEKSTSTI